MEWIISDNTKIKVFETGEIHRFNKFTNCYNKCKFNQKGYYSIKLDDKHFSVHRIVAFVYLNTDFDSPLVIDHIDRNIHNNHVSNLRAVTHQQNMFNKNVKGYNIRGTKFETQIRNRGLRISKTFNTKDEAVAHYLKLKEEHHKFCL